MLVCSDDNDSDDDNSDARLFFLDNDGRIMLSASTSTNTGEDGGVEYVSTSSDIPWRLQAVNFGISDQGNAGKFSPLILDVFALYILPSLGLFLCGCKSHVSSHPDNTDLKPPATLHHGHQRHCLKRFLKSSIAIGHLICICTVNIHIILTASPTSGTPSHRILNPKVI